MNLHYLLKLLLVVVLKHAYAFRVSFRLTKLNHRKVGTIRSRTIPNASLEECLDACIAGRNCGGVNYSRMRRLCEVLAYDSGYAVNNDLLQQISYVFIDRSDMEVTPEGSENVTHDDDVSNPANKPDTREECDSFRVDNGMVLGNLLKLGSKIKVVCDIGHSIIDGDDILICLPNGTWSSKPGCSWDCGEPPSNVNANVTAGAKTYGSVRSYTCHDEFFVSGTRNETTLNVTCVYGKGWVPEPRCVQECEDFRVDNGTVRGNSLNVGSTIRVVCDKHHTIIDGEDTLECQRNRTWSSMPWCIWDCGEPPQVKGDVKAGQTTNGSVRSYTCQDDYFVSGNRNQTTLNVTCMYGEGWMPKPRCVQDCDEPKNAGELNAQKQSGQGIADYDKRYYYCSEGFVWIFSSAYSHYSNGTLYRPYLSTSNRLYTNCDGTIQQWVFSTSKCVKDCTERPSSTNVKNVTYTFDKDYNVTATYQCHKGHSVYDNSKSQGRDMFNTYCRKVNGKWTNSTLKCRNDTYMQMNNNDSTKAGHMENIH